MAQDTYQPDPPDTARCPHCGTTLEGAVAATHPALLIAALTYCCPDCRGQWSELRTRDGNTRFWMPVEAPPG